MALTKHYLQDTQIGGGTGGDIQDLAVVQGSDATLSKNTNNTNFEINAEFQLDVGDTPNSTSYSCSVDIASFGGDMEWRYRVQRVNSSNVVQASSGYSTVRDESATGISTDTLTLVNAFVAGDRLRISFEARRITGHGNISINYRVQDADSWVEVDIVSAAATVYDQNAFRFRTDDLAALNANGGGDWEDDLNTDVSLHPDKVFRLRIEIEAADAAETEGFQLRVQKNGAGGYALIPNNATPFGTPSADGQKRIQAVPSDQYVDLDATTDILSASGDSFIAGDGNEDNTTGTVAFTDPSHTEMEWAILIRKLSEDEHIADGDFFDFRVYRDDGTPLDTYTEEPRVTVLNDPGHVGGTRVETPARNWVATAEGVLYTIVEYTDITSKNRVVMMKSADGGDSWNPVDEVGAPTQNDLEACDMDYVAATDTIYIIIQGESNDDVFYWTFQTSGHASPDIWDIDQDIDVASSVATSQRVAIARRDGDSTTVAFYMDNDGSNDTVRYRILSGTTWGAEQTLDSEASREMRGVRVTRESDDTLHIFYIVENPAVLTEMYHRTMDPSDDSLSGRTQVDQTAVMEETSNSGHGPIGQPRIWDDGGTLRVGVAYQDGSRDLYWNQSVLGTIDFTNEALITTVTTHWNGGGSHSMDADGVVDDVLDEPWAFWVDNSDDDIMSNHEVSGSWGSDVTERTGIHHSISMEIFTHNGGNGGDTVIGIMIEDNPNDTFSGGTGAVRYIEPIVLASGAPTEPLPEIRRTGADVVLPLPVVTQFSGGPFGPQPVPFDLQARATGHKVGPTQPNEVRFTRPDAPPVPDLTPFDLVAKRTGFEPLAPRPDQSEFVTEPFGPQPVPFDLVAKRTGAELRAGRRNEVRFTRPDAEPAPAPVPFDLVAEHTGAELTPLRPDQTEFVDGPFGPQPIPFDLEAKVTGHALGPDQPNDTRFDRPDVVIIVPTEPFDLVAKRTGHERAPGQRNESRFIVGPFGLQPIPPDLVQITGADGPPEPIRLTAFGRGPFGDQPLPPELTHTTGAEKDKPRPPQPGFVRPDVVFIAPIPPELTHSTGTELGPTQPNDTRFTQPDEQPLPPIPFILVRATGADAKLVKLLLSRGVFALIAQGATTVPPGRPKPAPGPGRASVLHPNTVSDSSVTGIPPLTRPGPSDGKTKVGG